MRKFIGGLCAVGLISIGFAGETLTPQDLAIRKYLAAKAAELEREFLPNIKTAEDFEKARPELRAQYFYMLGLDPLPEKTPLNATVTGRIEQNGYVIEKLHFQSRPGQYVTCNLYRPAAPGKYPAILYQCGHSYMKRDGNKSAYQDHGIWFATHGYVALVTDTLQLGEIAGIHHGTYRENRWWWQSAGYCPSGVECWNAIRALDYLQTRPDVDPDRIGATGISGGGAATFWIAAADERIKASAPVSGMADLGFYVGEDGVNGHCDCMFHYNTFRWNHTAIAALICPRPLLFVNSDNDTIFPMSANERIINRLEKLYARFGASDKVDAVVSVGGHAYRTDIRRSVFEFFNRVFKNDAKPVTDADVGLAADGKSKLIETEKLRVFAEDKDIPADQINTRIDQTFVAAAKVELPKREHFESWKDGLLKKLRRETFGAWPESVELDGKQRFGFRVDDQFPHQFDGAFEKRLSTIEGTARQGLPWIVVLNESDAPGTLPEWARIVVGDHSCVILNLPGTGLNTWTRKNPPNTIERELPLLGATADSGRIWEIKAFVRKPIGIVGRGAAGILAAYAALYEPSIEEIVLVDPPASHKPRKDGEAYAPPLLNVLRVLDVPEAFGLLAPRKLTLINANDPAFSKTEEIYRTAGAADKLTRK